MAISAVRLGSGAHSEASGLTLVYTVPAAGVVVGKRVLVGYCSNNSDTDGAITCSDNKGNTYAVNRDVLSAQRRVLVFSAPVTTALVSGDTITVTSLANFTRAAMDVVVGTEIGPQDVAASNVSNDAAPTSGVTPTRTAPNSLIFGVCGWSGTVGGDTFSIGTNFTNAATVESFSGAAARYVGTEWQIVSAVGTDPATGVLNTTRQWSMIAAVYPAVGAGGRLVNRETRLTSRVGGGLAG